MAQSKTPQSLLLIERVLELLQNEHMDDMKETEGLSVNKETVRMRMEYYSHRGHSLLRHPKNLLFTSDSKQYWSATNESFERNECDWIIFKKKSQKNKCHIPKQIVFKNYKSMQDVKEMNVYIGDAENDDWHKLTKECLNLNSSKDLQYFDIDNFDSEWAEYQCIKLEFVQNFGERKAEMCRFCCRYFGIIGDTI